MKVLLINQSHKRNGGANTVYLNTGRILAEHGHEVVYFAQKASDNEETKWSQFFYDGPTTRFQLMRCDYNNRNASKQLESLLNTVHPDIAHIHELGNISSSIYSVLKRHNVPIIQTVHDYHFVCPVSHFLDKDGKSCELCKDGRYIRCAYRKCSKGRLLESIYATALFYRNRHHANPVKSFNGMIYVSNFSREKNLEHYPALAGVKNTVIYNSAISQTPSYNNGDYYLYFGRLSWEKGVNILIDAFINIPNCRLYVVGSGPLEEVLRARTKDAANIKFWGYQTGKDLQDLINNASFVVVPSICYENNPMAVVEAYSFGKPVIGSNSGAIPEIVTSDTGLLFEKNDVQSLVSAVLNAEAMADEEYRTLSNGAQSFFKEHFTDEIYYNELIAFYKQVLNQDHK